MVPERFSFADIGFESRWSAKEQLDENRDLKSENKAHHPLDDG
jgi:hypothetical protein